MIRKDNVKMWSLLFNIHIKSRRIKKGKKYLLLLLAPITLSILLMVKTQVVVRKREYTELKSLIRLLERCINVYCIFYIEAMDYGAVYGEICYEIYRNRLKIVKKVRERGNSESYWYSVTFPS